MAASIEQQSVATDVVSNGLVEVVLPTHTIPSYEQRVIGKASLIPGIEEFRGIPYGIVPARWQHALLRDRLPEDIFYATCNGPRCPQAKEPNTSAYYQSHLDFPSDVTESEFDCLNLFITRPSASVLAQAGINQKSAKLPVYLYIHGGAYSFGAGTDPIWDPSRLVKKSVELGTPMVVATINYRLNMFGFGAGSEIMQGQPDGQLKGCNFGLADQHIALRWVKQNVGAFGGDISQMTIGGQSAGGSSAHAHILEAVFGKREPLVQRAIIQSGAMGVLGPISMERANDRWNTFCNAIGAPDGDPATRLAFMSKVAPDTIVKTFHDLGWVVAPVVVDDLTVSESTNGRWNIHLDGDENPVEETDLKESSETCDVLVGDTDLEGLIHIGSVSQITSFDVFEKKLRHEVPQSFLNEFCQTYGLQAEMPVADLQKQLFHFLSDLQFGYHVDLARKELMKCHVPTEGHKPEFTARPTLVQSYRVNTGNPFPGLNFEKPHHCVDLIYIYDCFAEALRDVDESLPSGVVKNATLVEHMQSNWIQFITSPLSSEDHGMATIYNEDRSVSVIDTELDPDWCAREKRFEFLGKHHALSGQAMKAFAGVGHTF